MQKHKVDLEKAAVIKFESLCQQGVSTVISREVVQLRQRVTILEDKVEATDQFIHGFAELCGLGKGKVRNV